MDQHIRMSKRKERLALFYWDAKQAFTRHALTVGGILLLAVIFFGLPKVAFAQGQQRALAASQSATLTANQSFSVPRLVLPRDLGHVSHVLPPTSSTAPSSKLLILIQDAHVNYDAQQRLAKILDRLASTYGVRLILVEGGEGDADLSYLRYQGSRAAQKELAEEYLKAGQLSGEEYFEIVSDYPMMLWGVEDQRLYDAHIELFLGVERLRETVGPPLRQLRQVVTDCKARITNARREAVETKQQLFEADQLPFSEYLPFLVGEGERAGLRLAEYPHMQQAMTAIQLEKAIDRQQVAQEQRQALEALRQRVPGSGLEDLQVLSKALKAGQAEPAAFYEALAVHLREVEMPLERFPQLDHYVRYLRLQPVLQSPALSAELHDMQQAAVIALASAPEEAELLRIEQGLTLFERLIALRWNPHEFEQYLAHKADWQAARWVPMLQAQAARLGVAWAWSGDASVLDASLTQAARFYDLAEARDHEIVRHALAKMDEEHQQVAVLIAGGFHTDHLSQLLAAERVQVAVITPWVEQATDEHRYTELLKDRYRQRASTPEPSR